MKKNTNKKSLGDILEAVHKGFAYEVMELEIEIESQKESKSKNNNKISQITSLISLYMEAVEALESAQDSRYRYFSKKIQSLMTKKNVVQQLHMASGSKNDRANALTVTAAHHAKERKNEYEVQMFFNKEQFDAKKVKEMVNSAQNKFKKLQGTIQTDLKKQQNRLEQRLKMRKLRSEAGSVSKFRLNNDPNLVKDQIEENPFDGLDIKGVKKRKGSVEKQVSKLQHAYSSPRVHNKSKLNTTGFC